MISDFRIMYLAEKVGDKCLAKDEPLSIAKEALA